MLKKLLLIILSLFIVLPAFSGEFEEASRTNRKIFLYMYTANCGYCKKFEPTYNKVKEKYGSGCKFLKIDANTEYGGTIMSRINASYVPYVVMIDNQKQTMRRITPQCLMNYACTQDAVDKFVK